MDVLAGLPRAPRIAVVRALQLGDMLCAIPALRSLRRARPDARVTLIGLPWAREFASRLSEYLDDFLEFPGWPGIPEAPQNAEALQRFLADARARRFDLAIQLHGSGPFINPFTRTLGAKATAGFFPRGEACPDPERFLRWPETGHEIHRLAALPRFLGAAECGDELEFPLGRRDYREAHGLIHEHGLVAGRYACLHPGGRMLSRRWSLDKFAAVAEWLSERGLRVVLTGAPFEQDLVEALAKRLKCEFVNAAGRTTVGGMAALLIGSRLLVSNDTGVSHLAAALRVPSVVVVLGSDPSRWAPLNARLHRTVLHAVACRPCGHYECPIGFDCERELNAPRVLAALEEALNDDRAAVASSTAVDEPTPIESWQLSTT